MNNLLEFHICAYDKEDRFSSRQLGWIKAVDTDVFIYLHVLFASGVDHSYMHILMSLLLIAWFHAVACAKC